MVERCGTESGYGQNAPHWTNEKGDSIQTDRQEYHRGENLTAAGEEEGTGRSDS